MNIVIKTKEVITLINIGDYEFKAMGDVSIDLYEEDEEIRFFISEIKQERLPDLITVLNQNKFVIENISPFYTYEEDMDGNTITNDYTLHVSCKFGDLNFGNK